MPHVATNHSDVLEAVRDRLRDRFDWANESTCILSLDPHPPLTNVSHDVYATIAPEPGRYDAGAHEGGGENTTFEETGVVITIFSKVKLDRVGHADSMLTDHSRGIMRFKHDLLRAFSGHNLSRGVTSGENNYLLINLMAPLQSAVPSNGYEEDYGFISVAFSTDFEWDLTS